MEEHRYRAWKARVDKTLLERSSPASQPLQPEAGVAARIERVVDEARQVVAAVGASLQAGTVLDNTKYEFVLAMIDKLMTFEQFVLAEYTYRFPSHQRPGVRLLLERAERGHQISCVFFEDTSIWQVDWEGQRVSYQLLSLDLAAREPVPQVAAESQTYFDGLSGWQEHLREALCLPVRLLYQG